MVHLFTPQNSFSGRINFVDDNNVVLGWDTDQSCCEHAGWYFSYGRRWDTNDKDSISIKELGDYTFDADFFETAKESALTEGKEDLLYHTYGTLSSKYYNYDDGDLVRFRLSAPNKPVVYLQLFNVHNGYYGHGFTFKIGDSVIKEETL